MEENRDLEQEQELEQTQPQGYVPRPAAQVWAARLGLVLFLIIVAYQILSIATGGR